jgi:hypothetical protein
MKKLHIVLILSFILTPFFISIDTFEPAQARHRTTKSTIVLIEAGLEIKYLKRSSEIWSNTIEFIVILCGRSSTISNYSLN